MSWAGAARWVIVCSLVIGPVTSRASDDQVRQQVAEAAIQYRTGRFQESLDSYIKAYELSQLPALLFNIGQCHKMLKNHERALFFFEGFLREKPDAKSRPMVEGLIAESKKEIAAAAQLAEAEREQARKREHEAKLAAQAASARPEVRAEPAPDCRTPGGGARTKWVAGTALLSVGVAGLASALGLGVASRDSASELELLQGLAWDDQAQATYDTGARLAGASTAFYVIGTVLVGAGTTLVILGSRQRTRERAMALRGP